MTGIEFSMSCAGVDWSALRAALVADDFDNGRTPEQYRLSHLNSHAVVFGLADGRYVANGRILSDGVCNAYLVDIWTASAARRRGVGREVVRRLTATVPGQHVGLFTDDMQPFYAALGFRERPTFMAAVAGRWLDRPRSPGWPPGRNLARLRRGVDRCDSAALTSGRFWRGSVDRWSVLRPVGACHRPLDAQLPTRGRRRPRTAHS